MVAPVIIMDWIYIAIAMDPKHFTLYPLFIHTLFYRYMCSHMQRPGAE